MSTISQNTPLFVEELLKLGFHPYPHTSESQFVGRGSQHGEAITVLMYEGVVEVSTNGGSTKANADFNTANTVESVVAYLKARVAP